MCLVDGTTGKVLIRSQNLSAGNTTRLYRAKRLKVTFGNGQVQMRSGTRTYDVPDTSQPVGYDLRAGRKPKLLSASARPTCR